MSHHTSYCEKHDCIFQEGEFCPVSEATGEKCEFAAILLGGKEWPGDDRVAARMKCVPTPPPPHGRGPAWKAEAAMRAESGDYSGLSPGEAGAMAAYASERKEVT